MPVVKDAIRVRSAEQIGPAVTRALQIALTPPSRPVYVEIPTDLLSADLGSDPSLSADVGSDPSRAPKPDREQLERALALLERARRPLVWAGGGALQSGAGEAVARLAERLVAPVILTYSAKGLLAPGHPCLVESSPHVPEVGALWDEADVVVAVGSDLDGMMTQGWKQPQPPHLVAVNVDPTDASKNYRPDVVVEADARHAAAALANGLSERGGLDSLQRRLRVLNRAVRERVAAEDPEPIDFVDALEAALPEDAVVVSDMCIPGYWLGGFQRTRAPRKFSYPLGWGTLGCAFPQGLGAALADTGPAVSISGDGGFLYACGELAAAKQERIPLTAVVVDDGGYGMIRYDQDKHGDPREGVDLTSPDFVALAQSFGVRADSVDGLGEHFAVALKGHVALKEPTMLVARAALGPPPNVSPRWYRK
jgi:acetolactate synthase-1/2/3 large subunit